jgi:hypothetical protein
LCILSSLSLQELEEQEQQLVGLEERKKEHELEG